jgi:hypothetical protein
VHKAKYTACIAHFRWWPGFEFKRKFACAEGEAAALVNTVDPIDKTVQQNYDKDS